ncbi:MAG TPA: carbohydrate ABC transporter permease [Rectinemataceae bacterium]|nr:carbohydrate ABC transporter permease [Rectinemataceae bacterium]
MLSKRQRRRIGALLAYLVLIAAFCFFIVPMLWIAYSSFRMPDAIFGGKILTPPREFTLSNYSTVLSVTDFPRYFWNSIRIALLVTVSSLVISILGAYGLSRYNLRGKNIYIMGVFSTQMFPVVLLLIPIYNILFALRLFNTIPGVALGQLMLVLPFSVWMLKGYFDNLPRELEDSAKIDGCNLFQTLTRIVLPIAAPGVMVTLFYSFVVSWGDYLVVSVVSQSNATATLTMALQRLGSALILRWGQVAAATVLTIVPTIVLFSFMQTRLVEGLTSGAVKN